jgi:hypothetical protein
LKWVINLYQTGVDMSAHFFATMVLVLASFSANATDCANGVSDRLANDAVKKLESKMNLSDFPAAKNTTSCKSSWIRSYYSELKLVDNHDLSISCGVEFQFSDEVQMAEFFDIYLLINHGMDEISVFDLFADMAVPVCGAIKP